mmetsp:Transcript_35478/g.93631  ORF Transcript_35478/g.93631 Transcript_35478/m.93631 type:complete len:582 (+) Transcript_35478:2675-4420(+)
MLPAHEATAVEHATEESLDGEGCLEERRRPAARADAAEGGLEAGEVLEHEAVLLPRGVASPVPLDLRQALDEQSLVFACPVLAVPALQDRRILAVAAVGLQDIPHELRLLDHHGCVGLPPDGAPRERSTHVLLEHGESLLLVRLRQDVARVVRDHVRAKVVVVAVDPGRQARRLQALQIPVALGRLLQGSVEGVGVEEEPGVAVPRAVLVRLVVPRQEAPAVREPRVEERQKLLQPPRLRPREVSAPRHRHRPVLLSAPRLVHVQVARCAKVVRALMAPDDGIRETAFAAFHLDKAAVVPEELVRLAIVQVLSEASDHWVHGLQAVGRQVEVPARVVSNDHLPLRRLRVAQREQAVPVARWVVSDAQLRRHVLDHLRRDQRLLHVVGVPAAPQEDAHRAEAAQAVRDRLHVQHVGRRRALLREAQLVEAHVEIVALLQACLHEEVAVDGDLLALGWPCVGLLVPGVELGLGLRAEREVGGDPLWDLPQGECLEGLLGEGAEPQAVEELDVLELSVRVYRMLRVPAVEGVNRLARIRAHDAPSIGEAPRVRVAHHDIDEVHSHVEQVLLAPLKLVPEGALHI